MLPYYLIMSESKDLSFNIYYSSLLICVLVDFDLLQKDVEDKKLHKL